MLFEVSEQVTVEKMSPILFVYKTLCLRLNVAVNSSHSRDHIVTFPSGQEEQTGGVVCGNKP